MQWFLSLKLVVLLTVANGIPAMLGEYLANVSINRSTVVSHSLINNLFLDA